MEIFIRNEGKINRVEQELGLSYPAVRARLTDVIRSLGYPVGEEEVAVSEETRRSILAEVASGKISADEAIELLQG